MVLEAFARLCGLSEGGLSQFLNVPPRRVERWISGEVPVSPGALSALRRLHDRQQAAADGLIASWLEAGRPNSIDYVVASDDDAARRMGWPSRGAQLVVAAVAQAEIAPARIMAKEVSPAKPEELDEKAA